MFHCIGQVTIEFHVEKETNFIVLHIQDLNVTEKVIFCVVICVPTAINYYQ